MKKTIISIGTVIVMIIILVVIAVSLSGKSSNTNSNDNKETSTTVIHQTTINSTTNSVSQTEVDSTNQKMIEKSTKQESDMIIEVNGRELLVKLADNSSARALQDKLKQGNIIIDAHDYSNFEKVGELGFELPQNNEQISTDTGDVILYLGTRFVLYYDTNSWNFTRLGWVTNVSKAELKQILGEGDAKLTLRLN